MAYFFEKKSYDSGFIFIRKLLYSLPISGLELTGHKIFNIEMLGDRYLLQKQQRCTDEILVRFWKTSKDNLTFTSMNYQQVAKTVLFACISATWRRNIQILGEVIYLKSILGYFFRIRTLSLVKGCFQASVFPIQNNSFGFIEIV